jgi:hypothetical protein
LSYRVEPNPCFSISFRGPQGTDFLPGICLARCGKEIWRLTWHSKNDIRGDSVPDPKIEHGRDAIIKVTACAICGSNLHLFDGGASWSVYDFLRRVLLLQNPNC